SHCVGDEPACPAIPTGHDVRALDPNFRGGLPAYPTAVAVQLPDEFAKHDVALVPLDAAEAHHSAVSHRSSSARSIIRSVTSAFGETSSKSAYMDGCQSTMNHLVPSGSVV